MQIQFDNSTGKAKVIDPNLGAEETYLDDTVLQALESNGKLNSLEKMNFFILNKKEWEISDPIPFGTPGTAASAIFSIRGNVHEEQDSNVIVCTLG